MVFRFLSVAPDQARVRGQALMDSIPTALAFTLRAP